MFLIHPLSWTFTHKFGANKTASEGDLRGCRALYRFKLFECYRAITVIGNEYTTLGFEHLPDGALREACPPCGLRLAVLAHIFR